MKKLKLKSSILMAALLLGGGTAGAQVVIKIFNDDPLYNWTGEGMPSLPGATVDDAIEHYGCSEGNTECARGESLDPNVEDEILFKAP